MKQIPVELLTNMTSFVFTGDWHFVIHESDQEIQDMSHQDDEDIYVTVDEDADFDESESSADSDEKNSCEVNQSVMSIRREAKMLDGIAKYLIPVVGHGVETLVLSQSKGLNNAVVRVNILPSHVKNYTCIRCQPQ